MKTFKQYNESVTNLLQPKSNDEMIKALEGLSKKKKIEYIIRYQLDFDLLPRNKKGICIYKGSLSINDSNIKNLPDNLTVNGHLYCSDNKLTELPKGLKVVGNLMEKGHLNCSYNMLTELPGDMKFNGDLSCTNNALVKLPDNLTVNGHLYCYSNMLTELPKGLYVKQSIYAGENLGWLVLPKDAVIGGNLYNSWKSI